MKYLTIVAIVFALYAPAPVDGSPSSKWTRWSSSYLDNQDFAGVISFSPSPIRMTPENSVECYSLVFADFANASGGEGLSRVDSLLWRLPDGRWDGMCIYTVYSTLDSSSRLTLVSSGASAAPVSFIKSGWLPLIASALTLLAILLRQN